jgi:hypothetical protein
MGVPALAAVAAALLIVKVVNQDAWPPPTAHHEAVAGLV